MPTLDELNALPADAAKDAFFRCCGSSRWATFMAADRPYADQASLLAAADRIWAGMGEWDQLEAFTHHPRIGEQALREKFASTAAWASGEQAGAAGASEEVLKRLAAGNDAYFERNGFIFIVCATGLSAEEMLARLEARLGNDRATEIANAAEEQRKITRIRLEKLLAP